MYDKDIRPYLKEYINNTTTKNIRIVDELSVSKFPSSICDVVVLDGQYLHGYEIKSKHDSLTRLDKQVRSYSTVMRTMTLVLDEKHLKSALLIIPDWWGILTIDDEGIINRYRENSFNQDVKVVDIVNLLWRAERYDYLVENQMGKGNKSKSGVIMAQIIINNFELVDIENYVVNKLMVRTEWKDG